MDNGPEFIAQPARDCIVAVGPKTAYIKPGSLWKNGYCVSFAGRFRDELLNGEIFYGFGKHRSSSKNGRNIITQRDYTVHWGIVHRHRKPS